MSTDQTTDLEADLAALEQRAIDGEPVTPEELAHARERATLAGLARKGQAARQEAAERQAAHERREQGKREAAALLANIDSETDAAAAAVIAAVETLAAAVAERNRVVEEAAHVLDRVGLPSPNYSHLDPFDVPNLDREYFVSWGHGMQLNKVTVAGESHHPVAVASKVVQTMGRAVQTVSLGRKVEIQR
ncbi:hypothetical protein [Microbacterium sp. LMC-P-041]|uniref:hypothetical protein n=1 Tax=Microbacterium sp. LMC-P-041 TaxID=3040293 RepID=UPI002553803E|nr:hypothetical protein [Microbacterium sp. LMC-P-041]